MLPGEENKIKNGIFNIYHNGPKNWNMCKSQSQGTDPSQVAPRKAVRLAYALFDTQPAILRHISILMAVIHYVVSIFRTNRFSD